VNKIQIATRFFWNYLTASSRPLPDFVIIGAQKAGTSSLFEYLAHHPDVCGSFIKEVQYFTSRYWIGRRGYRAFFPKAGSASCQFGEATPYYLFCPESAERVFNTIPDARIVALLREPVSRAYSHYKHNMRRGHESRRFEEAYRADLKRYRKVGNLLRQPDETEYEYRYHSYVRRGLYHDQLRSWMELFPKDQIFLGRAEDFFADPTLMTRRVAEFLGLREVNLPTDQAHNQYSYEKRPTDEFPDLQKFYYEPNQRLETLTGISW
jgi:hypothetical protein